MRRTTRPGPRLRLTGRARKSVLVAHLLSGGAWLGIDLALGILVVTALVADDPVVAGTAVRAVELFAIWPMFAAGLACLGTGTVLALASRYGVLRHWWVATKLVINVLLATLIVIALRPALGEAAEAGARMVAGDRTAAVPAGLLHPVAVAPTLLLGAYLLSVFKPWGRIRRPAGLRPAEGPAGDRIGA